jgi:hypothetical protein
MSNYMQKSYIPKFGNKDNFMENNIIEDITYLVGQANSGSGNQQVLGTSIWANGFRVIGCIGEDIVLPENANIEYTGPLSICVGSSITVPVGTTLTIV